MLPSKNQQAKASAMGDSLKLVTKLVVAADGRTAENWTSYKVQLEYSLAGKEVGGLKKAPRKKGCQVRTPTCT